MLVFDKHVIFCGDTTVSIDPTAEQLAQIAYSAARIVRTLGITPRIAMLSFSNFGSVRHPEAEKMARAVQLLRQQVVESPRRCHGAWSNSRGMNHPVHVLERGADVQDIVNMAAVAVMDAQSRDSPGLARRE